VKTVEDNVTIWTMVELGNVESHTAHSFFIRMNSMSEGEGIHPQNSCIILMYSGKVSF
jgi:hypothetical protein